MLFENSVQEISDAVTIRTMALVSVPSVQSVTVHGLCKNQAFSLHWS